MRDSSMAGLAKVLSKDTNITVTVSGDGSYIDHNGNINIAVMPDTPKGRMLTTGLTFHEVGHKNYSQLDGKPPGLLGNIANIIEDVWTERKTIAERPGTRFNLDEVTTHYSNTGDLDPKNLNHAICGKTLAYGRRVFLGQLGVTAFEPKCEELMDDAFGQSFIDELVYILNDIPAITKSNEAIEMARKVEALVINQKPKPQPQIPINPNPNNTPQGGDDEQSDSTQGSSQETDADEGGSESEEVGGQEFGDSDAGDIYDGGEAGQDEQEDEKSESEAEKNGSEPEPEFNQISAGDGAGGKAKLSAEEIDQILAQEDSYGDISELIAREMDEMSVDRYSEEALKQPLLPKMSKDRATHKKLDEIKAISASSKMRARMMGMLQDIKRSPVSYGASGKKLSAGRLVKIAFGDPRIFSRKKEIKDINTAVVICIDYSGSMAKRTPVSNPASYAIHHALHGLKGAAVASIGFGCCTANGDQEIMLLVNFKEKPISSKFNLPAMGGTPTHEAIWSARAMLLERAEPRKIIMIVTDGDPDCETTTKFATERTEKDGIEVAAIGINTSCVKRLWKKSKCIQDVAELPQAMFTVMDELLIGRA